MGYVFAVSPCIRCKRIMTYNPHKVPSTSALTGEREPVCLACYEALNRLRVKLGYEPWPPPMEGAYEPMPEEEL